ncbi:hypothetical protein N7467_007425 [Penicillium canescens]|nr:hypothetical protein N7467_007425 [Penicillium canescens]
MDQARGEFGLHRVPILRPRSGVGEAKTPWLATGLLTPGEANIVSGQGYDWACSLGPQQVAVTSEKQSDSCQFGFASHSAAASALFESGLVNHAETADGGTPMFVSAGV